MTGSKSTDNLEDNLKLVIVNAEHVTNDNNGDDKRPSVRRLYFSSRKCDARPPYFQRDMDSKNRRDCTSSTRSRKPSWSKCTVWNGHDVLQSLEAIDMLPVTPTFLVTSRTTHFDQLLQQRSVEAYLALIHPKYWSLPWPSIYPKYWSLPRSLHTLKYFLHCVPSTCPYQRRCYACSLCWDISCRHPLSS